MRDPQLDFSLTSSVVHDHEGRRRKGATMLAVLREVVHSLAHARVVDIGASTGAIDALLAEHCGVVLGLDIDRPAIAYASRHFNRENLLFALGDAMALPCADASVDVVVCAHVYEHVPDSACLMREIARVLKPGGVCYFSAGNRYAWREPHYGVPLLSVIPKPLAHLYLRLLRRGSHYYEEHLSWWGLRRLVNAFDVIDYTARLVDEPERYGTDYMVRRGSFRQRAASWMTKHAAWAVPGYIWILRKRG